MYRIGFLLLVMLGAAMPTRAAELDGVYSGKVKVEAYLTGVKEKSTGLLIVTVNEGVSVMTLFIDEENIEYNGFGGAAGPLLFISGQEMGGSTKLGGRLHIKGKPGKYSGTLQFSLSVADIPRVADITGKLKQLPPS